MSNPVKATVAGLNFALAQKWTKRVYLRKIFLFVALIAIALILFLSACSPPDLVMTPTSVPTPIATTTPAGTPTPPNEFFLGEIVKTPQPSPWATSLPNDLGITPGITTEAEVQARLGDPISVGCIIDKEVNWTAACQAPGGFRKTFNYTK
jgi:hypothetical protein